MMFGLNIWGWFEWVKERIAGIVGVFGILMVLIDAVEYSGNLFTNDLVGYAGENEAALSVIVSALLFYGYILQYRTSDRQRKIMETQTDLMDAGYTPIVGIMDRDFSDGGNTANLSLINRGNSLARDLHVETIIAYEEPDQIENHYLTYRSPVRRSSETTWWKPDQGILLNEGEGISEEDGAVKASADLKLKSTAPEEDDEILSEALNSLHSDGVDTVKIALVLTFKNAKMDESEIPFYTAECKLDRLERSDMDISRAMEIEDDDLREIKIHARG